MCDKSAQTTYLCNKCPTTAKPSSLNNGTITRQISAKMHMAHLLKIKGVFVPANRHTANLPGTKRVVYPTDASGAYIWGCNSDPSVIPFSTIQNS